MSTEDLTVVDGAASSEQNRGKEIPYQLRPNKFVDRQLFLEALSRLVGAKGPERYIYVSMGANHLVDHYAVYRELGIKAQFCFDYDANVVKRQKFNRPTDATCCEVFDSADLALRLDSIVGKFRRKDNLIIWLDYTEANWLSQFQEAEQILLRLRHGDIFRITLSAGERTLKCGSGEPEERAERRATNLRDKVGAYMPTSIKAVADDEIPLALARCFELVAQKAKGQLSNIEFVPVLTTSYRDGVRMLTITCAVSDVVENQKTPFPAETVKRWQFFSKSWDEIRSVSVPILSARERHRLDLHLNKSAKKMLHSLSFLTSSDEASSIEEIAGYKQYQRFYPAFRHVDD